MFDKYARRVAPGKKAVVKVNGVKYFVDAKGRAVAGWNELNGKCTMYIRTVNAQQMRQ